MKNIYIIMAMAVGFIAHAQGIKIGDLQGKWRLVSYSNSDATIDIEKGTFELKHRETLSPNDINRENTYFEGKVKDYKYNVLTFTNSEITGFFDGENYKGGFILNSEGTVFTLMDEEYSAEEYEVSLKGKTLYLKQQGDNYTEELVFKKN